MVASVLEGIFNANPNPTSRPLTLRELLDRTIVRVRKQVNDPASRAETGAHDRGRLCLARCLRKGAGHLSPLAARLRKLPGEAEQARLMDVLNQTAYASVSLHRYREAEAAAAEAALLARPQAASL